MKFTKISQGRYQTTAEGMRFEISSGEFFKGVGWMADALVPNRTIRFFAGTLTDLKAKMAAHYEGEDAEARQRAADDFNDLILAHIEAEQEENKGC